MPPGRPASTRTSYFYGWALVELIEAGARSGRAEEAAAAFDRLSERTRASGTEWALGVEARCRGLLGGDESLYQESVERLARSRAVVELARSRLLYGEWLRRENRRMDAREQLRAAHEMFSRMGAAAFAERTRRELSATGETVRKRTVETLGELTTQEAQVARLAAQGRTNPEIAAELFISPRTVEYHLHKVFPKLGISSRRELRQGAPGHRAHRRARLAPFIGRHPAGAVTHTVQGAGARLEVSGSRRERIGARFSLLKRGELLLEVGHRAEVQEGPPTHAGHAERGQFGDRRRLGQAHDIHRAAHFQGEAVQRVRFPQRDRVHAIGPGFKVGGCAPDSFGNKLLLGPGRAARKGPRKLSTRALITSG